MQYRIAPSILSADFARLGDEVRAVTKAGADLIHFDVMDNHYVPNLTVGPLVCAALKPHAQVPLDVHLMVRPVDRLVADFAKAGAGIISFHPEASDHVDRTIALIHEQGCKAGLVFNPATPLAWLDHTLEKLDLVLLMSVNPGFGGQQFIPSVLPKITETRRRIAATGRDIWLEVDGGIKAGNIAQVARAGADTFVAGSAIFAAICGSSGSATLAESPASSSNDRSRCRPAPSGTVLASRSILTQFFLEGTLLALVSGGIGILVACFHTASASGVKLVVSHPSPTVYRQLWISGLVGLLGCAEPPSPRTSVGLRPS